LRGGGREAEEIEVGAADEGKFRGRGGIGWEESVDWMCGVGWDAGTNGRAEGPPGGGGLRGGGGEGGAGIDPLLENALLGGGERLVAWGHFNGPRVGDGLEEKAAGGIAGENGGAAIAALAEGFGGAEIEAGHLRGAVAAEAFGVEEAAGGVRLGGEGESKRGGEEELSRHCGHRRRRGGGGY
jgi:hypothetical protein